MTQISVFTQGALGKTFHNMHIESIECYINNFGAFTSTKENNPWILMIIVILG